MLIPIFIPANNPNPRTNKEVHAISILLLTESIKLPKSMKNRDDKNAFLSPPLSAKNTSSKTPTAFPKLIRALMTLT